MTEFASDYLILKPLNFGNGPDCEECGLPLGLMVWLPPHRVEISVWGKECPDAVFGAGSEILISNRMKEMIENEKVLGFNGFEPVDLVRIKRMRHKNAKYDVPQYYRVDIVNSTAKIDFAASDFETLFPVTCRRCQYNMPVRWNRLVLDPGSAGFEDVFYAMGLSGTIFASKRFKDLCDQYKLRNTIFIPALEYAHDLYPGGEKAVQEMRALGQPDLGEILKK